jgi:hypothetical protein
MCASFTEAWAAPSTCQILVPRALPALLVLLVLALLVQQDRRGLLVLQVLLGRLDLLGLRAPRASV